MRRIGEMSRLTDSLIERAESLRNQTDVLAQAMEDAMRALVALPANASAGAVAPEPPAAVGADGASAPSLEADPAPRAPERARETPAMRAAKMAIAGSGREEIGTTLSREYAISDPDPILNEILGRDG